MNVRNIKRKIKLINDDYIARLFHKECKIGPDDIIVCSFPKSGRTWVRFFVGAYISHLYELGIDAEWNNFVTLAPGPLCNKESGLFDFPKGIDRVIFSHNRYVGRHFAGRKVVYITRNLGDILVSFYFFHRNRNRAYYGEMTLDEFVRNEMDLDGAVDRINYFSRQLERARDVLIIPYESLRTTPETWFKKFILFTNYEYDEKAFYKALEYSSFSSMRKMEREQTEYDSEEQFHTRQGAVNKASNYLDPATIEYVQNMLVQNLQGRLKEYYLIKG